ncbi:MAG: metal-dependent hydrolase [Methyloprofundus sp.]|nr:metal-dependent hydrolase [Methyloprofundus sp.]
MANFNTHLFVAASASGIAVTGLYNKQLIEFLEAPWFIFLGTLGGLLPDIDADNSRPLKLLFAALATFSAVLIIMTYKDQTKLPALFILASSAFLTVRFPLLSIFKRLTVHRGVFHSVLSAVFFTLSTVCISQRGFHTTAHFSWLSGLLIGFGFIVHLLLDELFSVDLSNAQLKRSFGSAFKLFSLRYLSASFTMFCACIVLYHYAPTFPFLSQEALTMINLALDTSSSTFEKYFVKLNW